MEAYNITNIEHGLPLRLQWETFWSVRHHCLLCVSNLRQQYADKTSR